MATVNRVVDKLLHTPTVRMKQLAGEPGGRSYAEALRQLFDLDRGTGGGVDGGRPGSPRQTCISCRSTSPSRAARKGVTGDAPAETGTRRSALAMAQARWVAERVQAAAAADGTEVDVELVEVTTARRA